MNASLSLFDFSLSIKAAWCVCVYSLSLSLSYHLFCANRTVCEDFSFTAFSAVKITQVVKCRDEGEWIWKRKWNRFCMIVRMTNISIDVACSEGKDILSYLKKNKRFRNENDADTRNWEMKSRWTRRKRARCCWKNWIPHRSDRNVPYLRYPEQCTRSSLPCFDSFCSRSSC